MQKDKDQGTNQNIVYHKAAMIDEQLFSLDVKADQLRFFLEQVVAVVNGHSNSINIIQNDILRRVQAKDLELSLSRISESISLRDMEFLKVVSSTLDKPLAETSGNGVEDATNRVINKEAVISSGMSWLYKKMNAWDTKLSRLDDELNLKVKKEDMSKKFKKTKKKLRDEMEGKEKGLNKKVHDIGVHTNQTIAHIQSNMSELEKKTLWKINDCETLLHKRINSEFVENSCKSVYDRIIKEMERMKEDNFKIINQDVQEMKAKITLNEDNSQEKLKGMRSTIKDFQDQLNLKFVNVERLEITRNALQDRISEIQLKIQDLQRKMDATSNLEKQIPIIQSLEEKAHQLEGITDLQKKELEELKIKFEVLGEMGGSSGTKSDVDPHKVCSLDADVKRLKIDNQDNENKLRQIDQEMKRKLDHFEQRIIGQLSVLKTNNSQGGVSKDEILLTVERDIGMPNSMLRAKIIQILQSALNTGTNQSLEQTLKAIIQDIADITKKTDSLMDLEKKIKRKFKQLTSNETVDFAKQLEEKADKEQLQKELNMMNEKYKTLQDLITTLRQSFSALEQFSEHIESLIQTNSQETISIITGNNRIIHQRCVVCGNKSKTSKTMCDKSQDYGQPRMYKGDARPNNIYEASDVYEIPPSQITLVQESQKYLSTTVGQKHPVVNFKESSKTDLSNTNQNTNQSTFYSPNRNFRPLSATQKKG